MSAAYWENRYAEGGTSGAGSTGWVAEAKAKFLNDFVASHPITSVAEYGCGDGRQLALARYPLYLGLDVSMTAVDLCRARFDGDLCKEFRVLPVDRDDVNADVVLSLDVIFHLTEDDVYFAHLRRVFSASTRYVILYTTDTSGGHVYPPCGHHMRHRHVTADVAALFPEWKLVETADGPVADDSDFFVYEHRVVLTPADVTPVIVTRGDHHLDEIVDSLIFPNVVIWDNATRPVDLGAYGRYESALAVQTPLVYFQDDDCLVAPEAQQALLDGMTADPVQWLSNMNPDHNAGMPWLALPGYGSLTWPAAIEAAIHRWRQAEPDDFGSDDWLRIGCDIVVPVLTPSRMVDLGHESYGYAYGDDRTFRRPGYAERKAWYHSRAAALRRSLESLDA